MRSVSMPWHSSRPRETPVPGAHRMPAYRFRVTRRKGRYTFSSSMRMYLESDRLKDASRARAAEHRASQLSSALPLSKPGRVKKSESVSPYTTRAPPASKWSLACLSDSRPDWVMGDYIEEAVAKIREQVGDEEVILGLSGGVDSSVAAALIHRAIGDKLTEFKGAAVILQDVTKFRLLDDAKTNLVGTVSHELKTPLTSLRMAVYLLLEQKLEGLTAPQRELLASARDDSDRLLRILDNLLDLARLEAGVTRATAGRPALKPKLSGSQQRLCCHSGKRERL